MLSRFCLSLKIAPSAMLLYSYLSSERYPWQWGPGIFSSVSIVQFIHDIHWAVVKHLHLYCVRLLWDYCELRISLDELLENFQHVLYDYSEMSKISFVEPLHSFLRYPCIHQGYMVYVHCIYFHRIVMEEEGQLFQPHRLSQPEDPCYCCHV